MKVVILRKRKKEIRLNVCDMSSRCVKTASNTLAFEEENYLKIFSTRRCSSVSIVTRIRAIEKSSFLPALVPPLPSQPRNQCAPGVLSPGIQWPGRGTDDSPPYNAEVNNAWSYISILPIRFHGVVLYLYLYLSKMLDLTLRRHKL